MFRSRRTALTALLVALPAVAWGLWPVILRPSGLAPLQAALVVEAVVALPALLVAWRDRAGFRDRGAVWALVGFGILDAAQCALYFPALARGPVAVAALAHYLGPVLVALAAPFVPGERTSRRAMVAAPLSLLGLALVMGAPRSAPLTTALLGAASAFCGAGCLFTVRRASRSFSPLGVCSLHAAVSAVLLLLVFGRGAVPPLGAGVLRVAAGAVALGLLASMVFVRAVRRVPAAIASTLTYVEPVTAVVLGALFLGQPIGPLASLGGAVVIGAGIWVALEAGPLPAANEPQQERRAA